MQSTVVSTRSGAVSGKINGGLEVFRGIPYARAPRGELRWQGPQPVEPWEGVRPAVEWGPSAPQSPAMMLLLRRLIGVALNEQSQDCLYLNVWTPRADGAKRPVMVWIHGGAFMLGSGATRLYDGAALARMGKAVVVTINYRLGALGFLNLLDIFPGRTQANFGMRDQVAALEWVRDNIEGFGGDPENVTIFGESAGGMSVGTLLGTPSARGLFHRAIAQSGASHNVSTRREATRVAECFLEEVGIHDLAALEQANVSDLMAAQQRTAVRMGVVSGNLPWQPFVDDDFLPEQPLVRIAAGQGARVPLIVGTNRDEWKLFNLGDPDGRRLDEDGLRRRLGRVLPSRDPEHVEEAIRWYRAANQGARRGGPADWWSSIQSDRIFHHPAHVLAGFHSLHEPRTFAYRFEWTAPLVAGRIGACHGLELPFVFGTTSLPVVRPLLGFGRAVSQLSERMMRAWLEFARRGDPNQIDRLTWPNYEVATRPTIAFGRELQTLQNPYASALDFWNAIDPLTQEATAGSASMPDPATRRRRPIRPLDPASHSQAVS